MKKLFGKRFISCFACLVLAVCMMPAAAFAQNTSADSQQTVSGSQNTEQKTDEKKTEKIQLSLGSSYKKVYDGKEITKSDVYALVSTKSGGASVFTYKWYDENGKTIDYNPVNAGVYKLKIKVSDKDPSYKGSATVKYIIEPRPLEWDVSDLKITKPYDGTADAAKIKGYLAVKGVIEGDDAALAYDSIAAADFPTADVQTVSVPVTVENAGITGTSRDNYSLPKISPTAEASIIKAYITEITVPDDDNQYRLVVEETVSVTEDLKATEFNTEENIKTALRAKIAEMFEGKKEYSVAYLKPVLQVLKNDEWVDVAAEDMPQDNLAITLKYPETAAADTHEFVIYKMKTSGDDAGTIEVWAHTEKVEGIETALSQGEVFAVGYTPEKQTNMTAIIIIGAIAVMVIAGAVFVKLHRADKQEVDEEVEENPAE